ncbi:MAG: hemolysin family protein [Pseudomonadota bacterium]
MLVFTVAVLVVLVCSFLCSIAESVLLSVSRPQIETMVQEGKRAGTLMAGFKEHFDVPIAAILILNTAAHTVGASVAGASFSTAFNPDALWVFSILFTLAVLLFTEIIPKTLGVTYAPSLATPVAHGIHWLVKLLWPIVAISERLSRLLRPAEKPPVTSREEIRLLAMLGRNEGAVAAKTAGIVVGATQLADLRTEDVMLPRQGVRYLHTGMARAEVERYIRQTAHSRFPFSASENLDDVTGIVLVKELLYWMQDNPTADIDWTALVRDALIVPSRTSVSGLMRTFQQAHRHMAVVVDEYGGVDGIVTLEDVLEEIVGEIQDEKDAPDADIRKRYDGARIVRATVDMRRIAKHFGIAWERTDDATTIGGMMVERLERIPEVGESIEWQGYQLEVINADDRRVKTVVIRELDPKIPEETE